MVIRAEPSMTFKKTKVLTKTFSLSLWYYPVSDFEKSKRKRNISLAYT